MTNMTEQENREMMRRERRRKAEASRRKKGMKSIRDKAMEDRENIRLKMLDNFDIPEEPASGETAVKSAENRPKPAVIKILIILLIGIAVIAALTAANMVSLLQTKGEAAEKIEELQRQKQDLELQLEEVGTESYMEKYARNWLKMTKSGEIVYKFEADSGASDTAESGTADNTENNENNALNDAADSGR